MPETTGLPIRNKSSLSGQGVTWTWASKLQVQRFNHAPSHAAVLINLEEGEILHQKAHKKIRAPGENQTASQPSKF